MGDIDSGYIMLTSMTKPEDNGFVSLCLELDVSGFGDTIESALSDLNDAIWVQLNGLEEIGEREREFKERGIKILQEEDAAFDRASLVDRYSSSLNKYLDYLPSQGSMPSFQPLPPVRVPVTA